MSEEQEFDIIVLKKFARKLNTEDHGNKNKKNYGPSKQLVAVDEELIEELVEIIRQMKK